MKRLMLAMALLTTVGLAGCRWCDPDPAPTPVYCAPACYQPCQPQVCAPAGAVRPQAMVQPR